MLHGRDVSAYQGAYNFELVKGSDAFAFAKATEGLSLKDAEFPGNWSRMHAAGLLRGAYHFGHPGESAAAQAQFFAATVKAAGLAQFDAVALDLETTNGLGPSAVSAWAQQFVSEVQSLTGKNCFVYSMYEFLLNGCTHGLQARPLWIASLTSPGSIENIHPWQGWTLQQYTWSPVDMDVLNGDVNSWKAVVNMAPPAPTYKVAQWTTAGQESLAALSVQLGNQVSAILRLTAEHSPNGLFPANIATYINGVFAGTTAVTDKMPAGLVLYYMQEVNA